MRERITSAAVLCALAMLAGCATLKVKVEVLTDAVKNSPVWIESEARGCYAEAIYLLDNGPDGKPRIDSEKERVLDGLKPTIKSLEEISKKYSKKIEEENRPSQTKPAPATEPKVATNPVIDAVRRQAANLPNATVIDPTELAYSQAKQYLVEIRNAYQEAINAAPGSPERRSLMFKTRDQFDLFRRVQQELPRTLATTFKGKTLQALAATVGIPIKEVPPISVGKREIPIGQEEDAAEAIEAQSRGLVGKSAIFDDPMAPVVVSAPDDCWAERFNSAEAFGGLGNTDIAIKCETIGRFTIKGVRVDASKVTTASFAAIRQGVSLVAAAYGLPTPISSASSNDQTPTTTLNNEISQASQKVETLKFQRLEARRAAINLLGAVLAEKPANDGKGKEVAERLESTMDSNQKALSME